MSLYPAVKWLNCCRYDVKNTIQSINILVDDDSILRPELKGLDIYTRHLLQMNCKL